MRILPSWTRVWFTSITKGSFFVRNWMQYAVAKKERTEGNVWEVSTRTTSLDKEILPSLCAKVCLWHVSTRVSTMVSVETERRRNRAIDTCMELLSLIRLSNGYSSVLQKQRKSSSRTTFSTLQRWYVRNKFITMCFLFTVFSTESTSPLLY